MINCISCGAAVPPEWVHAIESNVCPGCGGAIMNDENHGFVHELGEAMASMPNDPRGIAGWLFSNYYLRKIDSAEPVEKFHRKQERSNSSEGEVKHYKPPSEDNKFLKNAGLSTSKLEQARQAAIKAKAGPVDTSELAQFVMGEDGEFEDGNIIDESVPTPTRENLDAIQQYIENASFSDSPAENLDPNSAKYIHQQNIMKMKSAENFKSGGGAFKR